MATTKCVPIIDMEDVPYLGEKIARACEELGCFRLKNHGIPTSLLSDMKDVTRSLLHLPLEVKMNNYNPQEPSKGYTPRNSASSLYDGLGLYDMASPQALEQFCSQINASPHQRETLKNYTTALNHLVHFVGGKMLEGLGVNQSLSPHHICQLKLNKYDFNTKTVGLLGAKLHTDAGLFTILLDDEDVNGLEIISSATGEVISVDPVPGTFVINIGDAGKVWSNGRFNNVKHRVACYKATTRITIALFVIPPKGQKLEVIPKLVDSEHPALYVPFDFEDYRQLRYSTHSAKGEALQHFRSN